MQTLSFHENRSVGYRIVRGMQMMGCTDCDPAIPRRVWGDSKWLPHAVRKPFELWKDDLFIYGFVKAEQRRQRFLLKRNLTERESQDIVTKILQRLMSIQAGKYREEW